MRSDIVQPPQRTKHIMHISVEDTLIRDLNPSFECYPKSYLLRVICKHSIYFSFVFLILALFLCFVLSLYCYFCVFGYFFFVPCRKAISISYDQNVLAMLSK